ncbi:MAG: hypothetical protein WKG32_22430 [Gemmatimonadaceae bacterium]
MASDDRKDRKDKPRRDTQPTLKDLSARDLDPQEGERVKGGTDFHFTHKVDKSSPTLG